jgi:hypothetical protein
MAMTTSQEVKPSIKNTQQTKPMIESASGITQEVIDELIEEINNMLSYAVYNGIIIRKEVNSLIQSSNIDDLINTHNLLCENIAPATPKSINFLKNLKRKSSDKMAINSLPSIRNLLLLAFVFLAIFIGFAMFPEVNSETLAIGILGKENSNPLTVLKILIYLGAVSGIGVLFFLLKNTINSLKSGTLIPEDSVEYTIQIMLGIMAGVIMTEIVPVAFVNDGAFNFHKPVLALLGGFSSDAIFSILKALIDKLKHIFISTENS